MQEKSHVALQEESQVTLQQESHITLQQEIISDVHYIGDLQLLHFVTPKQTKRHLDFIKQKSEEDKKKIKILQIQKKRLENYINFLNNLLDDLKEKNSIASKVYSLLKVGLS